MMTISNLDEHFMQLVLDKNVDSKLYLEYRLSDLRELKQGEYALRTSFAALNYKDKLKIRGVKGLGHNFPITPGIDGVGSVTTSLNQNFKEGMKIIVSSSQIGLDLDGSFSEQMVVPGNVGVPLPSPMSAFKSMVLGTAGLTAAHVVDQIMSHGHQPKITRVLVNGGDTGVGFLTTAILAELGFPVASTIHRENSRKPLLRIGAEVTFNKNWKQSSKSFSLLPERWDVVVDLLGGIAFTQSIASLKKGGVLYQIGNILGDNLSFHASVCYARGISIHGITTDALSNKERIRLWSLLSSQWNGSFISLMDFVRIIDFKDLKFYLENSLQQTDDEEDFSFKTVVCF